jgi:hypothetical protein
MASCGGSGRCHLTSANARGSQISPPIRPPKIIPVAPGYAQAEPDAVPTQGRPGWPPAHAGGLPSCWRRSHAERGLAGPGIHPQSPTGCCARRRTSTCLQHRDGRRSAVTLPRDSRRDQDRCLQGPCPANVRAPRPKLRPRCEHRLPPPAALENPGYWVTSCPCRTETHVLAHCAVRRTLSVWPDAAPELRMGPGRCARTGSVSQVCAATSTSGCPRPRHDYPSPVPSALGDQLVHGCSSRLLRAGDRSAVLREKRADGRNAYGELPSIAPTSLPAAGKTRSQSEQRDT